MDGVFPSRSRSFIVDLEDSFDEDNEIGNNGTPSVHSDTYDDEESDNEDSCEAVDCCLICNMNLSSVKNLFDREKHIKDCLSMRKCNRDTEINVKSDISNNAPAIGSSDSVPNLLEFGLLNSEFYCVICDLRISRRGLQSRCRHLKRCARTHGVSVKKLLSLVNNTTDDDLVEDVDVIELTSNNNSNGNIMKSTTPSTATTATSVTIDDDTDGGYIVDDDIIIIDDSDGSDVEVSYTVKTTSARTPTTTPTAVNSVVNAVTTTAKNAFTHIMSSARMMFAPISSTNANTISSSNSHLSSVNGSTSSTPTIITPTPTSTATSWSQFRRSGNNSNNTATATAAGRSSKSNSKSVHKVTTGINNNQLTETSYNPGDSPLMQPSCPTYKKITCIHPVSKATSLIIVDGFQYAHPNLSDCYFLTHFHSDHTIGLEKGFNAGRIYCSVTTAALLRLKMKIVNSPCVSVIALDLERVYTIYVGVINGKYTGVTSNALTSNTTDTYTPDPNNPMIPVQVTCMDANHCPGAIVILFTFPNGKRVLHTGDFRWNDQLLNHSPTYRSLKYTPSNNNTSNSSSGIARNLTVYLDTTYCQPNHTFPSQATMIDRVVECVLADIQSQVLLGHDPRVNTLYVFGAYGIGKERVYMSVANALGCKVIMDKTRWRTCLCYDEWNNTQRDMLSTMDTDSNVHVISMGQVNFNYMVGLRQSRPGCTRVVGFSPTGWSYNSSGGSGGGGSGVGAAIASRKRNSTTSTAASTSTTTVANGSTTTIVNPSTAPYVLKPRTNGTDLIYSIPYSEHSSFSELTSFVNLFRPSIIIPTVNTSESQVKQQILHLKEANPSIYTGSVASSTNNTCSSSHNQSDVTDHGVTSTNSNTNTSNSNNENLHQFHHGYSERIDSHLSKKSKVSEFF